MNKNLLSVIVSVVGVLVIAGFSLLLDQLIPSQIYKTFTTMGMVRYIINVLVALIIIYGGMFPILRKYGVQITPITSPRAKTIWVVLVAVIGFGLTFLTFFSFLLTNR